jgi:uncharacterized protein (DUF885 family)
MRSVLPCLICSAVLTAAPKGPLDRLYALYWEHQLRANPELATAVGDPRYNGRLSDHSPAALQRELVWLRAFLAKVEAVPVAGLGSDRRLTRDLLVHQLKEELEEARFRPWEIPFTQMGGLHTGFPQLFSSHPFRTLKDFEDFISRLQAFPKAMDVAIAHARRGMKHGNLPPKLVMEATLNQVRPLASGAKGREPFLEPLKAMPASIGAKDRARLQAAVEACLDQGVTPAYARLLTFLEREYLPLGRVEPGLWAAPEGSSQYLFLVRRHTTTKLTPGAIHELGLREVARLDGEMEAIGKRLGFADLPSFRKHVAAKADLHPKDGPDLVARYQGFVDGFRPQLPNLFGRLPKAGLIVVPTEAFREQGAAAADYHTGTPDGSRPGRFSVNTFEAAKRTTLTVESTAYHEALPGHHLQLSIAQELEGLPEFQKHTNITAFAEGWALYSERLPKELGFYQDPYSDYGRLNDEMLRAVRLVVDTGVHHLKWPRQQMVEFFRAHGSMDEVDIQSETDRYIANPGQALAYKVGQLKILELRERAQRELGPRFDQRTFHDLVLGAGALPLDLLETRVDRWIKGR